MTDAGRAASRRPPRMLSLRGQALALLSRREHSRSELRQKLLAHARKRLAAGLSLEATPAAEDAANESAVSAVEPDDELLHAFLLPLRPELERNPSLDGEAVAQVVDSVLDWLAEQAYLSDTRFMESRVHSRASKHGTARIRQEIARHGLKLEGDTLQQLRDTEFARARELWARRFPEPAGSPQERARQMRFLAARGFAADVVRRVVSGRDELD